VGECVTLTWATEGVREVYYQERGVVGNGSVQECPRPAVTPPVDIPYTLRVVLVNGESTTRTVTVRVN